MSAKRTYTSPVASLDPGVGLTERAVVLPDGRRIRTVVAGDVDGPVIVFDAGWPTGCSRTRRASAGFTAYEAQTSEFVAMNQNLVGQGGATLFSTTTAALEQRNNRMRRLATIPVAEPRRPILHLTFLSS